MKRMVKNGDRIDVEPDGDLVIAGNTHVDGRLQVNSSIIANGEIRGGDISGTKFLLGTEEMPLVKANPAGDAAGTLEKIKIGDVAYNVGGGSGDREITLTMPYSSEDTAINKKVYIDDETYSNINNFYYEKITLIYNDGEPIGTFHLFNLNEQKYRPGEKGYFASTVNSPVGTYGEWYGTSKYWSFNAKIIVSNDSSGKYLYVDRSGLLLEPIIQQSKFDALYKLADKPTQDGTYTLKATVSGGAVTYTWVAE